MRETCEHCRFYGPVSVKGADFGFCRRHAPRTSTGSSGAHGVLACSADEFVHALKNRSDWARWPAVTPQSWCGEFDLDEDRYWSED